MLRLDQEQLHIPFPRSVVAAGAVVQGNYLEDVLAGEQARRVQGVAKGGGRGRVQRRKIGQEPGPRKLVETLGGREILQLVLPEVAYAEVP